MIEHKLNLYSYFYEIKSTWKEGLDKIDIQLVICQMRLRTKSPINIYIFQPDKLKYNDI